MKKLVLFGAGYFDVIKLIDSINAHKPEWEIIGFIDDRKNFQGKSFLGHRVIGGSDLIPELAKDENTYFFTTYFDPFVNFKKRIELLEQHKCKIPSLIHPAIDLSYVKVGRGCILPEGCILGTNVEIGDFVSFRLRCTINHDAKIQDYAFIGPGALIGSSVLLKKECFIGANASVLLDRTVGQNSYVGGGAVVQTSVPDGITVVGVPAKKIKRNIFKKIYKKFVASFKCVNLRKDLINKPAKYLMGLIFKIQMMGDLWINLS